LKILYFSQYFPPEAGATQTRSYEMATNLARLGHEVTVICEIPNHPRGVVFPEYRGKRFVKRHEEGITILHVPVLMSTKKNFKTRMLFYISYMIASILAGLFIRGVDIVYATSPPLFVGIAGRTLALIRRKKFVLEIRDLWPEAAVQLGEIGEGIPLRIATWLEHWCYRGAQLIVVVTKGAKKTLESARGGIYANKLRLVPNGSSMDRYMDCESDRPKPVELEGKFVAVYGGIMGIAQGLHTLVEAADRLKDKGVLFFMIGEGPLKEDLIEDAERRKLDNMLFYGEVPREEIPHLFSMADVGIVPLRKVKLFTETIPSKLYDMMMCGLPVVLSVDGEAREVLEASGGGIFVEPENAGAMAKAILKLKRDPEAATEMGHRGQKFVLENYSRRAQAEMLEKELISLFS